MKTIRTFDTAAVKAIPILDYLQSRDVEVKNNRCAATWRQGDNPQAVSVNPDKNLWFDFVEGVGGTVIDLAMKVEGLTFAEARLALAKRYGIQQTDVPVCAPAPKPPPLPNFVRVAWAVKNKDIRDLDENDLPAAERIIEMANGATDDSALNEAIEKTAVEFKAEREAAASTAASHAPATAQADFARLYERRKKLSEFPDPVPDEKNPLAIFRDKYLRRGQMLLIVSTLGVGKSTFVSQGSECWARGKAFMGFVPVRQLKVGVFETEDDADEVGDFRNNISKGLKRDGWTELEVADAEGGTSAPVYYEMKGVGTSRFLDYLDYCTSKDRPDVVVINPAYDFIEGDFSKAEDVHQWKTRLLEIAAKNRFAVILIHHTNKVPTNAKERDNWCTGTSAAYAGSGSMVLPSSARAVVFIRPLEKQTGLFEINAAKRGKRLGWRDLDGNPTTTRYAAHSKDIIYWREATPDEVRAVATKKPQAGGQTLAVGVQRVIDTITANGKPFDSVADYRRAVMDKYQVSDTTCDNWLNKAIDGQSVKKVKLGGHTYIGLATQFEDDDD